MKSKIFFLISVLILSQFPLPRVSSADTVILKNGERLKGLIIDEFKDRIILSTVDGEKSVMKVNIRAAFYDNEEKAILQKARNFERRGMHVKAYYAYGRVLELDPGSVIAAEKVDYLRKYISGKMRNDLREDIDSLNSRETGQPGVSLSRKVVEELGFSIRGGGKYVYVDNVSGPARASDASRVEEGDRIVSVWGEPAAYMDVDEVAEKLLSSEEISLVVERSYKARVRQPESLLEKILPEDTSLLGADLLLEKDGVVVRSVDEEGGFGAAGIREGDLFFRVNGSNTRYLPMGDILKIVRDNKGGELDVVVRRNLTLWNRKRD